MPAGKMVGLMSVCLGEPRSLWSSLSFEMCEVRTSSISQALETAALRIREKAEEQIHDVTEV